MKKIYTIAVLIVCLSNNLSAQKQNESAPYDKAKLDSMFQHLPRLNQPFNLLKPDAKTLFPPDEIVHGTDNGFETSHPGAVLLNKTSRGTIYIVEPDNMAVLLPSMKNMEKMPTAREFVQPRNNMPNPLYPQRRSNTR